MNESVHEPAVRVDALCKQFGALDVLRDVSLTVARGEVAAVLGPSGGGKTTFLRCLNGLEDFQSGAVTVAGVRLAAGSHARQHDRQARLVRRRTGMVFQQFNLFPHRTVIENVIEAPVHVLGTPRAQAVAEAEALLARVGMRDKMHQMPDTLSGGQQQRVAIARALAMRPEVLLFDEPTSALDPRMAGEVERVIIDLAAGQQTMIVVTHSLGLARRAARTVHVFEHGRVLESGAAEQIFAQPRHEATRRFLREAGEK